MDVETEGVFMRRGLSPFTVLIFAAALLVGSLIVVSMGSEDGAASETTVAPIDGALVPTPSPIDFLDSFSWSRVPHDETVFGGEEGQEMVSVTAGGPGFVAVGFDGLSGVAVWVSDDGISWSRAPHDASVFGGVDMRSVAAGGPGLVAVGSNWPVADEDDLAAVVLTSLDGITWSRVPHDESVFGGGEIRGVTVGGPGLVAVGHQATGYSEDTGWERQDAAVWTSVDGITWSRIPDDESVFGGAEMHSVTVGGPGLVAVGSDRDQASRGLTAGKDAAVWTSVDGYTWFRVPYDESVFGGEQRQEMLSVTAGGVGLVAVGYDDWRTPIDTLRTPIWASVDGVIWFRVAVGPELSRLGLLLSVTAGGPGLVAVGDGLHSRGNPSPGAVVWTSVDGITWIPRDNVASDNAAISDVVFAGSGLIAVGYDEPYESGDRDAAVWLTGD